MAKLNKDQGNRETQQSRSQQPGGKHIDQSDGELEKLEREQQKARQGDKSEEAGPTSRQPGPHR